MYKIARYTDDTGSEEINLPAESKSILVDLPHFMTFIASAASDGETSYLSELLIISKLAIKLSLFVITSTVLVKGKDLSRMLSYLYLTNISITNQAELCLAQLSGY